MVDLTKTPQEVLFPTADDGSISRSGAKVLWDEMIDAIEGVESAQLNALIATPIYDAGGTGNDFTITTGLNLSEYRAGQVFRIRMDREPTGPCTLSVDGLAARDISRVSPTGGPPAPISAGDWKLGDLVMVEMNANRARFLVSRESLLQSFTDAELRAGTSNKEGLVSPANMATAIEALAPGAKVLTTLDLTSNGDYSSIPSGAKHVRLRIKDLSLSGTDDPMVFLGDAGGVETSGYVSINHGIGTAITRRLNTGGFQLNNLSAAVRTHSGVVDLVRVGETNEWEMKFHGRDNDDRQAFTNGSKTLSAELTTVSFGSDGSDTLDGGSVIIEEIG